MLLKGLPVERSQLQAALRDEAGWKERNPEKIALLEELLGTIGSETFPGAIIPRLLNRCMVYYAVSDTLAEWRNLRPLLRSAVGVTLTDFSGSLCTLRADDPFEALLAGYGFPAVARFSPHGVGSLESATVKALLRLLRALSRGGRARREVPRSTAQVLYDFRLALASGDRTTADDAIDFLRQNLRLDALNLHFLEVQRDADLQEWARLSSRPFFGSLCQTRRPPKVTAALAEALYRAVLLRYELAEDPAGAVDQFRTKVQQQYGALLAVCPPSPRPAVAKLFLVAAVASSSPDRRLVAAVRGQAQHWSAEEARFVERLVEFLPPEPADEAPLIPSDFNRQIAVAADQHAPATLEGARATLLSATALQSLEAYRVAVEYILRLAVAEREALVTAPIFNGIWSEISRYAGTRGVPRGWKEWAEWLPELGFDEARACAEQAVDEWPIALHLRSPQDVESLTTALYGALDAAEGRLGDALPHLVTWVQNDERWPNPDYKPLYEAILAVLLLSNNRSGAVLGALVTLLEGFFTLGMDNLAYSRLLNELQSLTADTASLRTVDWLLDLAELTVVYPCPDEAVRARLWSRVVTGLNRFRARLTPAQFALAADIAATLGLPETFSVPDKTLSTSGTETTAIPSASGLIAIYTLSESVGQRAQRVLGALFPDLRVALVHDPVATPRLQQMARGADLFVICWTTAKHAATTEIQQKRPPGRPVRFAPGGGSSSIVRVVQEYYLT